MNRDTIVSRDTIAIAATGATLLIAVIAASALIHQSISSLRHDVHGDIATLRGDVTALRTEVADFRERVVRDIGALGERIARLEMRTARLETEMRTLRGSGYES